MMLIVDEKQAQLLRELIEGTLIQVRIASARDEMDPFREVFQERARVLEQMLSQLPDVAL